MVELAEQLKTTLAMARSELTEGLWWAASKREKKNLRVFGVLIKVRRQGSEVEERGWRPHEVGRSAWIPRKTLICDW